MMGQQKGRAPKKVERNVKSVRLFQTGAAGREPWLLDKPEKHRKEVSFQTSDLFQTIRSFAGIAYILYTQQSRDQQYNWNGRSESVYATLSCLYGSATVLYCSSLGSLLFGGYIYAWHFRQTARRCGLFQSGEGPGKRRVVQADPPQCLPKVHKMQPVLQPRQFNNYPATR